ncbi:hypothetical protein M5K25_014047 [Dendrobium thyrsiflorum]|uniref:Uncharacterized protein n=1 Tax=Dendrobium thyrsiflorum TaxID=117978 RepID=A0ABD0V1R4_DENTH
MIEIYVNLSICSLFIYAFDYSIFDMGGTGNDGGPGEKQPAKYRARNANALVEICATEENGVDIESEKGGIADDGAEEGARVGGEKGAEEFEAAGNVRSEGTREEERAANENLDEVGATGAECVEDLELVVDGADVWEGKRRAAVENCGDLGGSATPLERCPLPMCDKMTQLDKVGFHRYPIVDALSIRKNY